MGWFSLVGTGRMVHKAEYDRPNDEVKGVKGNYLIFLEEEPRFASHNPVKNVRRCSAEETEGQKTEKR